MRNVVSFYCPDCNENFEVPVTQFGEDYIKTFGKCRCICPHCGNNVESDRIIEVSSKE